MMKHRSVSLVKKTFLFLLFFVSFIFQSSIFAFEDLLKDAISKQQHVLQSAHDQEKGGLLKELSLLYLKDQELEKALNTFLEALKYTGPKPLNSIENQIEDASNFYYKEALCIYLDSSLTTEASAEKIVSDFGDIYTNHPKSHLLGFLVALAKANLGQYDQFFSYFYESYRYDSTHFLAFKTKAILHSKLYERSRTEEQRESHRADILSNLLLAAKDAPIDYTIYQLLIFFASEEDKREMICRCLNKILDATMIIPRGEVFFFVREAVDAEEYLIAEQFIKKARSWYPQSRLLNKAEAYLDVQRTKKQEEVNRCRSRHGF